MVIYATLINLTKKECILLLLLKSYLFLCLCVSESLILKALSPPVKYLTDRFKAVLLLWIFYVFLSCVCYAFVRVCLFMPCGHLLGMG